MNQSSDKPLNLAKLAKALSTLRRKHRISLNQLAKLTGISRRTLARLENATRGSRSVIREKRTSLLHGPRDTGRGARPAGVSARTAYRLAKALLGEEETERRLEEQTRLSRFLGPDPLYKLLDDLYHYPAFLFHDSPQQRALRAEFGDDYGHTLDLLLRSGFGTRNLGARLRAFRMQHDLTLIETAALLDLSKSELHRLERAERSPWPRVRYRILRLLTLPAAAHPALRGMTLSLSKGRAHQERLAALKALLAQPPPKPDARSSEPDPLAHLRHAWLAGSLKTKELAAALGVSPPHLIRLLRRDRRPSRKLCEQLAALTSRL